MFDFGCHRLEVLVHIFGPVRRAAGIIANVVFDREVEDTAAALLQFEAGCCATLAVTHAAIDPQDTLDVFGTRGSLHIGRLNAGDLLRRGPDGAECRESHPPAANLHRPLIEEFVDAVRSRRDPAVDGRAGRAIAAIEEQIYAARS